MWSTLMMTMGLMTTTTIAWKIMCSIKNDVQQAAKGKEKTLNWYFANVKRKSKCEQCEFENGMFGESRHVMCASWLGNRCWYVCVCICLLVCLYVQLYIITNWNDGRERERNRMRKATLIGGIYLTCHSQHFKIPKIISLTWKSILIISSKLMTVNMRISVNSKLNNANNRKTVQKFHWKY